MKVIVYTSITGDYDSIKRVPRFKPKGVDLKFILYTDQDVEDSKGWEVRKLKHYLDEPRKASRYYKINSHLLPEHDWSIWYDGCLKVQKNPLDLLPRRAYIALPKHPKDKCVYRHAIRINHLGLDSFENGMGEQIERYKEEGFPRRFGLFENCFIIRKNTPEIKALNQFWWAEYKAGCGRDQISLPYSLWKTKTPYQVLALNSRDNDYYYGWGQHKREVRRTK
jgi:hypothetical protein